jgi:hypothetical protein
MIAVYNKRFETPELGALETGRDAGFGPGSDPGLQVTVVFTTTQGTLAALRTAGALVKKLTTRIALMVPEVVPIQFSLDSPPVQIDFLERRVLALVSESGIDVDEINVEILLCRDRMQCLRQILSPRSLVVIGGRRRARDWEGRKFEQLLRLLGHRVIFVDVEPKSHLKSLFRSCYHSVLRPVLEKLTCGGRTILRSPFKTFPATCLPLLAQGSTPKSRSRMPNFSWIE